MTSHDLRRCCGTYLDGAVKAIARFSRVKLARFTDAFVQNGVIYFVPFNANAVGALYLEKHHFELVKIPNLAAENYKFWGAIQAQPGWRANSNGKR